MKSLKLYILLISLSIFSLSIYAQDTKTKSKKTQELKFQKIAFFTDKIGLTSEEAQVFWPIYNEYWDKKSEIITNRKKHMTYFAEKCNDMSNNEMIKYADQYIQYELNLSELLDAYHKKFKEILPIEKVMRIYMADYEFKNYLLNRIREKGNKDNIK